MQPGRFFIMQSFLMIITEFSSGEAHFSTTWGLRLVLPEGYFYEAGDGRDRFSFVSDQGGVIDLVVYGPDSYESPEKLALDLNARLGNRGDSSPYSYRHKRAVLMELDIPRPDGALAGWALCVELESKEGESPPLLAALAYGPSSRQDLQVFYLSALDSIAPSEAEKHSPGPVTEFSYPRGEPVQAALANRDLKAWIAKNDAEAAQALVDREFAVLRRYLDSPLWQEAWIRFYRALFRDSYERLADLAFVFERDWHARRLQSGVPDGDEERDFAQSALAWVQDYAYERDLPGSDFVNLVSAATEGRGDCDSRALLWAVMLIRNNIPAAIMVSRHYGHAMGLARLREPGAVFELNGLKWIVAETTARVDLGRIGESVSDPARWTGIVFE
jgi:hypothetical protein